MQAGLLLAVNNNTNFINTYFWMLSHQIKATANYIAIPQNEKKDF